MSDSKWRKSENGIEFTAPLRVYLTPEQRHQILRAVADLVKSADERVKRESVAPSSAEAAYARRHVAIRWALTLVEPLLPPDVADSYRRAFAAQCEAEPEWSRTLLAGIIADIAATLPGQGPWRSVSARAGDLTVGANPPEHTGATRPDGQAFGTSADFDDLVEQQILGDTTLDLAFSPVARPATPEASAVIAFSFDGWQATSAALEAVADSGTAVHDIGTEAARWLTHRRRCHGLYENTFVYECAWTWGWRADKIAADGDWIDSEEERDFSIRRLADASVAALTREPRGPR